MNTRQVKRELKIAEWTELIRQRLDSGLSVDQWCEQTGISRDKYFYWLRIVREASCAAIEASTAGVPSQVESKMDNPVFAKVNIEPKIETPTSGIEIIANGINVHIAPDSNLEHVRLVLEAITYA